jgi:hypothetical protein
MKSVSVILRANAPILIVVDAVETCNWFLIGVGSAAFPSVGLILQIRYCSTIQNCG